MKRTMYFLAGLLAAAFLTQAAVAQDARSVTITHPSPETSHFGVAAAAFKTYVEENSGGRYKVQVLRVDNERESIEAVQFGAQQFFVGTTGAAGNFLPQVRVFDIPFLFRDYAHARAVLDGTVGAEVLRHFTDAGLVGMAFGENGFRHLTTTSAMVHGPADIAGLKIRTMENKIHITAWRSLGVLPTPLAFSELPTALQQGVVDGQENPISVILSNNFDQLQGHLYLTKHVYSPGIVLGSPDFLDGLSAEDRALFDAAAKEAVRANRAKVEADEAQGIAALKERGMDVEEIDGTQFRDAMGQALKGFEVEFGSELLAAIQNTAAE